MIFYDESTNKVEPEKAVVESVDYRDLDSFPEKVKQETVLRKQYIDAIYEHLNGDRWTDIKVEKFINDFSVRLGLKKISSKTLRRWRNSYENAGQSILALVPKHHCKGNSTSKIDSRTEIFLKNAIKYYLSKERISIADAYEAYDDSVTTFNDDNNESLQAMSYRAFYDRIHLIPLYERTLAREGNKKAKMVYRTVSGHEPVSRVMEEINNSGLTKNEIAYRKLTDSQKSVYDQRVELILKSFEWKEYNTTFETINVGLSSN